MRTEIFFADAWRNFLIEEEDKKQNMGSVTSFLIHPHFFSINKRKDIFDTSGGGC
jgi:hypothetical protein